MSVIEEALRRAQKERPAPAPKQPPATEPGYPATGRVGDGSAERRSLRPPEQGAASSTSPLSLIGEAMPSPSVPPVPRAPASTPWTPWTNSAVQWLRLGIVGTGVVAMAFWTYRVMLGTRHMVVSAPRAAVPMGSASFRPADAAPQPPPPPPEPVFALNGVVRGVGEPFAIINGMTVRLGEMIEDATLLEVDSGMAKLRRKGKDLVLRTEK